MTLIENIENNPKYEKFKTVLEVIPKLLLAIEKHSLFVTKTVHEILWGYEDPLYKLVHELDPTLLPAANFSLMVSIIVTAS